ncbi:MAG TPA: Hpt domain-containing protein [Polyangiaceae bacterium]
MKESDVLVTPGEREQRAVVRDALDYDGLLARLTGDLGLVRRLLEAFTEDLPRRLLALENAIGADDAAVSLLVAHSLQGAAATVGADEMRAIAIDIEAAAQQRDLSMARARLPALLAAGSAARLSIARYLDSGSGSKRLEGFSQAK